MNAEIVKICAVALLCATVSMIGRGFSGGISVALKIAGAILIFSLVAAAMSDAIESAEGIVESLGEADGLHTYWSVMLRALGIAVLCRICTDVCRDCGETTVAGGVEAAGKISILILSLPIIEDIIDYAEMLLAEI